MSAILVNSFQEKIRNKSLYIISGISITIILFLVLASELSVNNQAITSFNELLNVSIIMANFLSSLLVNEMVDDLFQLTKLENVDYELNLNRKDFVEFLRRIISEYYNEAVGKDIFMDIRLPEYEIFLNFDEVLVSRAVSNIIVNGIKHNPRRTKLRVELKAYEYKLILEIGDNGHGIPEFIRKDIFEPFIIGDESRKSIKGTGLGLAISKKIFEKHGWELKLSNPRKDEKTIFSMIIPIK